MKLILTSDGLSDENIIKSFRDILGVSVSQAKALLIAYAQTEEEKFFIKASQTELEQLDIEVSVLNMGDKFDADQLRLDVFQVVYVCGGNTFAILQQMRVLGVDTLITHHVQNGAVYIGVSAGSIIAGPDIEIAGWGADGDSNDVQLQDTKGLGFTNVATFPHFEKEIHTEEVDKFTQKVDYPVQAVPDGQALIVDEEKVFITKL